MPLLRIIAADVPLWWWFFVGIPALAMMTSGLERPRKRPLKVPDGPAEPLSPGHGTIPPG